MIMRQQMIALPRQKRNIKTRIFDELFTACAQAGFVEAACQGDCPSDTLDGEESIYV